MKNLVEKLTDAFNELDETDQIQLWNDYCEVSNMMDDIAISADEVEELYPLSSFDSVQECIRMYSSVTNDVGEIEYDYVTLNGYGYLVPFNADRDIDVEELVLAIADENLRGGFPDEIQDVLDEEEEDE